MSRSARSDSGVQPKRRGCDARRVLEIDDLKTHFFTAAGVVKAVDGVSYSVRSGETLGVVGESGCGKSVTALSVLRLVANPPGRIVGGAVRLRGQQPARSRTAEMEDIRGNDISMIFQEPMTSLNPLFTVGRQIGEAIAVHQGLSPARGHAQGHRDAAARLHARARAACAQPIRTRCRAACASAS